MIFSISAFQRGGTQTKQIRNEFEMGQEAFDLKKSGENELLVEFHPLTKCSTLSCVAKRSSPRYNSDKIHPSFRPKIKVREQI